MRVTVRESSLKSLPGLEYKSHWCGPMAPCCLERRRLIPLSRSPGLTEWLNSFDDLNMIPEHELIERFWPGGAQPVTQAPDISVSGNQVVIKCDTEGASIGYQLIHDLDTTFSWKVYTGPIEVQEDFKVKAIAHRLGYRTSDEVVL